MWKRDRTLRMLVSVLVLMVVLVISSCADEGIRLQTERIREVEVSPSFRLDATPSPQFPAAVPAAPVAPVSNEGELVGPPSPFQFAFGLERPIYEEHRSPLTAWQKEIGALGAFSDAELRRTVREFVEQPVASGGLGYSGDTVMGVVENIFRSAPRVASMVVFLKVANDYTSGPDADFKLQLDRTEAHRWMFGTYLPELPGMSFEWLILHRKAYQLARKAPALGGLGMSRSEAFTYADETAGQALYLGIVAGKAAN
jgi:hypothetical protein